MHRSTGTTRVALRPASMQLPDNVIMT